MKKSYFNNQAPRSIWYNPLHFIAFGFGSGAISVAPGSWGTLVAVPFYLLLRQLSLVYYLLAVLVIAILAILLCDKISREIGVHDHPGMNIDEFVGFFVAMTGVPTGWLWLVSGFILFRIFDIVKPPPINWIDQNVHGGLGMVLDDIIAGLLTCVLLQIFSLWC